MPETMHLIGDLRCSHGLDDSKVVESFMRSAIDLCKLTIEHFYIQTFPNGSEFGPGITGMALLSESHMIVHTAPEREKFNIDLFSCRPFRVATIMDLIKDCFGIPTQCNRWDLISR